MQLDTLDVLDVLIAPAMTIAGIIIVRSVFVWRIFDRKKKRHDDDDSNRSARARNRPAR